MKRLFSILFFITLISCSSDDRVDDPIPFESFPDIFINVTLPSYTALQVDGGHIVIPDGATNAGIRGIIVYRESSSLYRAFEQNCSFQPFDPCANVETFALYMQDSCCGSTFSYSNGNPTGGLAWRPLGQYEVLVNGNNLIITDNVLNY